MARKALNQANLEKLGARQLSALVMDLVQGNADLQRRARMELSAAQGSKEVAADIRKRFAALRRASSFLESRKQKALVKELEGLLAMVEASVAADDPDEAFELLWSLLLLAPAIHERTDDSSGLVGDVLHEAMDMIAQISPRITINNVALAERILKAVREAGYGEFDGIIPATAVALGEDGLEHLKTITGTWQAAPPSKQEIDRYRSFGLRSSPEDSVQRDKHLTASVILSDIADAQGDVDAYMARYTAEQLTYGTVAPGVAARLLDAGRVEEAYNTVMNARAAEQGKERRLFRHDLDEVYEACLERLGHTEELKRHLWATFEQTLSATSLRKYLKLLPDFEDLEAEEEALTLAVSYPFLDGALRFLIEWPAHERAAEVVLSRANEIDGDAYYILGPAAEALEVHHPLAATVLRRAMIRDTLAGSKSTRYRHAVRHLNECEASDPVIADYKGFPDHVEFLQSLKDEHARKHGFWRILEN